MEDKLYLISEEELINLLQNKKNMSICVENNLINKEDFGSAFIEWITEECGLEGELDHVIVRKEYNNWVRNFINSHYCSFDFDDEEEPIPTVLH